MGGSFALTPERFDFPGARAMVGGYRPPAERRGSESDVWKDTAAARKQEGREALTQGEESGEAREARTRDLPQGPKGRHNLIDRLRPGPLRPGRNRGGSAASAPPPSRPPPDPSAPCPPAMSRRSRPPAIPRDHGRPRPLSGSPG